MLAIWGTTGQDPGFRRRGSHRFCLVAVHLFHGRVEGSGNNWGRKSTGVSTQGDDRDEWPFLSNRPMGTPWMENRLFDAEGITLSG